MRRAVAATALLVLVAGAPLAAQVHPGGRWVTLATEHFRVQVRPAQRPLGERAAREAEWAYAQLEQHLPAPRGPIDLVVADNADYANAYATPYPSPKVVVYPYPPTGDVELQRYDDWLRLVITHELAHVFHLDIARGWWRLGRAVFGRLPAFFPNLYLPTWLIEGTAVHYESALTGSGRDSGSYHPMVVEAQAVEGGGMPIDAAAATSSPRWPGGYRAYAFGGEFLRQLSAARGDTVVDRLALATARQVVPYLALNGALKGPAGLSFTRAWSAWQREARRDTVRAAGAAAILSGLRSLVPPRVSRDGRRLLLIRDDGLDEPRLAVWDRDAKELRTSARVNGALGVAWDTGGAVVASEWDFEDPYTVRADLVGVDAAGHEHRLTHGARLTWPDVAPDGAIAAVQVADGLSRLVVVRGDSIASLTGPLVPGIEWMHPRWSPDGRYLAATRALSGRLDIELSIPEADGRRVVRPLMSDAAIDQMPAFSPDGSWLFWTSDRSGRPQVYATPTSGGGWWRVTDEPFGAYGAAPASDSVFYLAYHADGYRLTGVPFDTARWTPVAPPSEDTPIALPAEVRPVAVTAQGPYRPWRSLLPKYWMPIGVAGTLPAFVGAFTSGQDALERHAYSASLRIGTGAAAGKWQADVAYRYAGLPPAALDAAYSRTEEAYVVLVTTPDTGLVSACCYRTDEASLGVSLVHRRYRWSAVARLGAELGKESDVRADYRGAVLGLSAGRVVEPAFAISAQRGWRASVTLRQRWFDRGDEYTEGVVRGALYLRGPRLGFARQVVAVRAAGGALLGARPVVYAVGGVSGGAVPVIPGVGVGSTRRDFPVRGFQAGDAAGNRVVAAAVELRTPLALVGRGLGLLPGSLDRVSLTLFADGAAVRTVGRVAAAIQSPARLASVGSELVADLGVAYDVALRLRMGVAQRVTGGRGTGVFAAVGAAF